MKAIISFTLLLSSVIFFASCTKTYVGTDYPPQDPIQGSWVLSNASEGTETGWYGFTTGLESGVFHFYSDGSAQYSDAQGTLSGQWYMQSIVGNYYDQYGSYHYDRHETLEIHLSDHSGSAVNLAFD